MPPSTKRVDRRGAPALDAVVRLLPRPDEQGDRDSSVEIRPAPLPLDAAEAACDVPSFATAVRACSRASDNLGSEAMFLDIAPATALALPSVIVVFAAASSAEALEMVGRITAAAAECARALGVVPLIAVMDAESERAAELAGRLGFELRGRGESCWLTNGAVMAHTDRLADDGRLHACTTEMMRRSLR